jgi:hypothetical protein
MNDVVLRAETGGLTNEDVIKVMKAICDRQNSTRRASYKRPSQGGQSLRD